MRICDLPEAGKTGLSQTKYFGMGSFITLTLTVCDARDWTKELGEETQVWRIVKSGTYETAEAEQVQRVDGPDGEPCITSYFA